MRRLRALVAHLPQDSALARAMGWWWTDQHELSALNAELGHANFVATLAVAGVAKSNLPKPLDLPRPVPEGASPEQAEKPGMSLQSIRAAMLGGGVT